MNAEREIPDDEIRQHMDFDGLLMKREQVILKARYTTAAWIVSGVIVIGVLGWYVLQQYRVSGPETEPYQKNQSLSEVRDSLVTENTFPVVEKTEEENVESKKEILHHTSSPRIDSASAVQSEEKNVAQSYLPAEPIDGYPHLYAYFNANLVYPAEAMKDSVEGAQVVNFIINKEGKPEDIRIDNSLGTLFDAEAIRLIKQMPLWKPATLNNKPVKSRISIPLTFRLEKLTGK